MVTQKLVIGKQSSVFSELKLVILDWSHAI